jgi:hypothetical protein
MPMLTPAYCDPMLDQPNRHAPQGVTAFGFRQIIFNACPDLAEVRAIKPRAKSKAVQENRSTAPRARARPARRLINIQRIVTVHGSHGKAKRFGIGN